ncbi:MAG: cation-translocating P-type ATPase, partial [Patescibacteria group bacterium]
MSNKGLSQKEVLKLRKKFGENALPSRRGPSWPQILFSQFKSPLIYILLVAALIPLYSKEYANVILLGFVIVLNVLMGFYQEYNAQRTLSSLRKILTRVTVVIRDGARKRLDTKELVPGDLAVLGGGDRVPADGKLINGVSLLVNEAILTGEEEAVTKTPYGENNKLFMGTTVLSGTGIMKVEKTGQRTEVGKIGESLQEIKKEKTPIQLKLGKFSKSLAYIILGISLVIFLVGTLFYNQNAVEMLKISVILAVAAIPEGLPIAITVILSLGMRRVLKRKGLVRRLLSIETLGSTSVICTDKTGTITEGIMKVVKTDFRDRERAMLALSLTNNQKSNLEVSLWRYIGEKNKEFQKFPEYYPRVFEEPFDSEKKYTKTINKIDGVEKAFLLGAPEIVLSFCRITPSEKNKILGRIDDLASRGLRILGLASKEEGNLKENKEYSWLGLVGIEDPIREGVKEAVLKAQKAGIEIKIVTGDYRKTAERVAEALGFSLRAENVMEGEELETISDKELKKRIDDIVLFTRVTPHQKLKIVKALQEKGEIVAMTGDGVNDAPALKKADIGVAVGEASDVAKESADLILLDNNLRTIISACEEGRLVFHNIQKVVSYVLSNSFVEMVLIFGAMLLKLPAPLTILQILWVHLICDGPPDIILSFEPKDKSLMKERPEEIRTEEVLSGYMMFSILAISLATGILALLFFMYFHYATGDIVLARTIAFATIASVDLIYVFAFKNLKKPIIKMEN